MFSCSSFKISVSMWSTSLKLRVCVTQTVISVVKLRYVSVKLCCIEVHLNVGIISVGTQCSHFMHQVC